VRQPPRDRLPRLRRDLPRDAFQLIRAGLAGGKGIPESVAAHPVVFATFTAPSFGPVHSRPVRSHTCAGNDNCRCKPEPCHPRRDAGTCPHGRPLNPGLEPKTVVNTHRMLHRA
jgi:hypothetical protein